jgi:hypothetical protein
VKSPQRDTAHDYPDIGREGENDIRSDQRGEADLEHQVAVNAV